MFSANTTALPPRVVSAGLLVCAINLCGSHPPQSPHSLRRHEPPPAALAYLRSACLLCGQGNNAALHWMHSCCVVHQAHQQLVTDCPSLHRALTAAGLLANLWAETRRVVRETGATWYPGWCLPAAASGFPFLKLAARTYWSLPPCARVGSPIPEWANYHSTVSWRSCLRTVGLEQVAQKPSLCAATWTHGARTASSHGGC